jgi:hypothetical protein
MIRGLKTRYRPLEPEDQDFVKSKVKINNAYNTAAVGNEVSTVLTSPSQYWRAGQVYLRASGGYKRWLPRRLRSHLFPWKT